MTWYYKDGDKEIGPVRKAELQQLIKDKQVGAKTLVRSRDMDQWRPLADMVRRKPQAEQAQTVPPAPPDGKERDAPKEAKMTAGHSFPSELMMQTMQADEADYATLGADETPQPEEAPTVACSQCGRSFPRDQILTYDEQVICASCKPLFIQKLREGVSLPTILEYGGFWIRFLAKFIDSVIMGIAQWAVMIPVSMVFAPAMVPMGEQVPTSGFFAFVGFQVVLSILLPMAYSTFFIGRFSATLGKMACRLKVVTPDGGRVSYARALGRFFAEMISYMILLIGYIMAAFDDEKRTLHDRICSTRVVRRQ